MTRGGGRQWLETMGAQLVRYFQMAPNGSASMDEGGWLALTGERSADLNMACVLDGPRAPSLLTSYVRSAHAAGVPLVLMLEHADDELFDRARELGAEHVGEIPIMVWSDGLTSAIATSDHARPVSATDELASVIGLMAEAFSLDLGMCLSALAPLYGVEGVTFWLCEREGEILGTGVGIRSGEVVGIYSMATPERHQRQGVGKAVLSTMMANYLADGVAAFYLGATSAGFRLYEQLGYRVVAEPPAFVIGTSTQFHQ